MRVRLGLGLCLALALPGCDGCGRDGDHDPVFIPLSPGGVAASPLSTTRIQVTWTDQSQDEYTFIVQTSPDNIVWTDAATVGLNVTTAVVSGLVPGVQIFVQVIAFNSAGRSPPAGPVAITPPVPSGSTPTTGPAAILWSCAAVDTSRNLMFVFGGSDGFGGDSDALYACDLSQTPPTWSPPIVSPLGNTTPTARFGSSMIYDPLRDRLVVFGGQAGGNPTAELWEFRPSTSEWFLISTSGTPPEPRQHQSAVYDSGSGRMVIYGGEDGLGTDLSAVHALTLPPPLGGTPAWSSFTPGGGPTPLTRHSAIYDGDSGRMIVFAGIDNDLTDSSSHARDVWTLDLWQPTSWNLLATAGTPPGFRDGHMAVWDSVNAQMVVYGGADDMGTVYEELWTLTLGTTPTWRLWSPTPTLGPRQYGVAGFDPLFARLIVFGGIDDTFVASDQAWTLGL